MLLDSSFNSISNTTTGATVTVGSGTAKVPEIDPASTASALSLLLGGLLVLRDRRRQGPSSR
jgi:hypothetical protein